MGALGADAHLVVVMEPLLAAVATLAAAAAVPGVVAAAVSLSPLIYFPIY